jgi:hypothetical protein
MAIVTDGQSEDPDESRVEERGVLRAVLCAEEGR